MISDLTSISFYLYGFTMVFFGIWRCQWVFHLSLTTATTLLLSSYENAIGLLQHRPEMPQHHQPHYHSLDL